MDNHMFSDDQIGEINELLGKAEQLAREEGRKEGYEQGYDQWFLDKDEVVKGVITQYKEELLKSLPKEAVSFKDMPNIKGHFYEENEVVAGFNECLSEVKKLLN